MSGNHVAAFVLFAVVAAVTPGPSNIILTSVGANAGVRRGLNALLGVALGMGLLMFVVSAGIGSLVVDRPIILRVLRWCGVGFLLWLAGQIATAGRSSNMRRDVSIGFGDAAALQWVNPKAWLVSVSAASTYLEASASSPIVQSLEIGVIFMLAALPCCFLWLASGAMVQRLLAIEGSARAFNITMGVCLVASILLLLR